MALVRRSMVARAPMRTTEGVLRALYFSMARMTKLFSRVPMMERTIKDVVNTYLEVPVRSHSVCVLVFCECGVRLKFEFMFEGDGFIRI